MRLRHATIALLSAALALPALLHSTALAQNEIFIPLLVYRTGPYAPNGIPSANGFNDYFKLLNARDGGINGVKIVWEECETQYNTARGVECYEKLKGKGPTGAAVVNPFSTGITYQLIPKASVDQVPIHSMGYGRTAAADGRVFKWTFNFPTTYWSQASAVIRYIGQQEGGMDNLDGLDIVHVYHNSAYGKEANPTLETLSQRFGYKLHLLAVDHPGQEQRATWLQVRRIRPDYVFMSGWGVMNQVAIKEAAAINFPMDHFIGNWWSGSEADVVPAGQDAKGYKSATFHAPGSGFDVHRDILRYVYNGDEAAARQNNWGDVLYNRTLINAMFDTEAIRTAMERWGNKPMTGEQVRWGMENLKVTQAKLDKLGFGGQFTRPLEVTCADHEGSGPVLFQQWDGKQWSLVSDWLPVMRDVVRPMIEKAAMDYAKENNINPRDC